MEQLQLSEAGVDLVHLKDVLQLTHDHRNVLVGVESHVARSVTFLQFCRVHFYEIGAVPPVVVDHVAAQVDDPDVRSKDHCFMRMRDRTSLG